MFHSLSCSPRMHSRNSTRLKIKWRERGFSPARCLAPCFLVSFSSRDAIFWHLKYPPPLPLVGSPKPPEAQISASKRHTTRASGRDPSKTEENEEPSKAPPSPRPFPYKIISVWWLAGSLLPGDQPWPRRPGIEKLNCLIVFWRFSPVATRVLPDVYGRQNLVVLLQPRYDDLSTASRFPLAGNCMLNPKSFQSEPL